jgi:RNA polymerase sigma-70 factor (sigma-E family)
MSVQRQGGDPATAGVATAPRSVEILSTAAMDFATWVDDYQRSLLAFAQLVAGDAHTAEDLVQTALARAYLKWSTIGAPGQNPLAYVHRIIVNENASLWRRAWKRRERSTDSLPDTVQPEGPADDQTWALVQALPARQRAVIALRYYADLSVTQTAEAMGCSTGSVKTHTSRAIAKLKLALKDRSGR